LSVVSIGPEIDARTILPVLARPIRRAEYVVGRYLGTLGTTYVALGIMAAAFAGALLVLERGLGPGFWTVLCFVAVRSR
jgi:ABC-type transport system involved in multi-copper enzyme maturation permease subunit